MITFKNHLINHNFGKYGIGITIFDGPVLTKKIFWQYYYLGLIKYKNTRILQIIVHDEFIDDQFYILLQYISTYIGIFHNFKYRNYDTIWKFRFKPNIPILIQLI